MLAAAAYVTNVFRVKKYPPWKLPHTEIYATSSGRHHRCPTCFFLREHLSPWKFTVVTVCALLTRDLFAIAKFLVAVFWVSRRCELGLLWKTSIPVQLASSVPLTDGRAQHHSCKIHRCENKKNIKKHVLYPIIKNMKKTFVKKHFPYST